MNRFIHENKDIIVIEIILVAILFPIAFWVITNQSQFATFILLCLFFWISCGFAIFVLKEY